MVEVTNLDNGRKLTVRVNDRGPFVGNRIIDLSPPRRASWGYDRAGLAHVRVRYVGPAPLAGPEAGIAGGERRPADAALSDQDGAGGTTAAYATAPYAPPTAAAPKADSDVILTSYKAPEPISATSLAPLPGARPASASIAAAAPHADVTGQGFRIQAGAFSDQDNARRVAAQLNATGTATIEPVRNATGRRSIGCCCRARRRGRGYAVRDKVAAAGFADARVVKPF